MKNECRDFEIEPQDFDSIFLWKVFWKLLKQETPIRFFVKVFLLGALFFATVLFLVLFLVLVGDFAGA